MKLDKKIKKEIRRRIKRLPEMLHSDKTEQVVVHGSVLIEHGTEKTKTGQNLNPTLRYLVDRPKSVNHQTEAEQIYVREGFPGVDHYCETVKNKFTEQMQKAAE